MIKAAEKIQKQDYYPANLKDEIHVFSTTVTEKDTFDLHTDLPKIKVKNLDGFYATYYSIIVQDCNILGVKSSITFTEKLKNSKKYKSDEFQQSIALLSACRLTNTEMLKNQKLVSTVNRGWIWAITENMQKILLVVEK